MSVQYKRLFENVDDTSVDMLAGEVLVDDLTEDLIDPEETKRARQEVRTAIMIRQAISEAELLTLLDANAGLIVQELIDQVRR